MAAEPTLLDTGVLVAFLHADDRAHGKAVEALRAVRGPLLTTEAVLTESMHLLARTRGGPSACLDFFLRDGAFLFPSSRAVLARSRELMTTYDDLPADFADATLVALAEETGAWRILTLDRQDFSVYRGRQGERFRIRP